MLERIDVKFFKLAVGDSITKETNSDITARCPVCGDSKNKRKSRLHLYTKNSITNVNCFNGDCPVHNKTVYGFINEFFPNLLSNYKKENFKTTMKNLTSDFDVFSNISKKSKPHESEQQKEVIVQDLSMFLTDIEQAPQALKYIESRGLQYTEQFGKWYYGHQDLKIDDTLYPITNSIVIPLYYKNEMYGFYSRSISSKSFYTYMNSANTGYKIWNWFNVNKNEPVYIFEGIFDAISSGLSNCIALLGAKLPDERLKELQHPVFVLDNDKTGLVNSLNYAKRGHDVYIQPIEYTEKDMNELSTTQNNVSDIIKNNIFCGISAEIRIKTKL